MARAYLSPGQNADLQSNYQTIWHAEGRQDAVAAATYVMRQDNNVGASGAGAGLGVIYIDPADFPANGGTLYCRTTFWVVTNATTPVCNFTLGLYPVSASAGAAATVSITLGTVVTGSTCVVTAPTSGTQTYVAGTDFAFPAAGFYALAHVVSATMAANSSAVTHGQLQRRAV